MPELQVLRLTAQRYLNDQQIQQLSGGHVLKVNRAGEIKVERCWTLPTDQPMLRYRQEEDYLEHFRSLLKTAVQDRMRADDIVVLMSGGLDSTSIATLAQKMVQSGEVKARLTAIFISWLPTTCRRSTTKGYSPILC